ncbi:MAG: L-lactate permease [Actinomycetaceae bacterium]|nr:L-lactate permease [Actinomycetaceae bacterium]
MDFAGIAAAFTPSTTAVAGNLVLTAVIATIPLLVFFIMLGVFKIATQWCALAALAVAFIVAIFGFHMPAHLALLSATQGGTFGLLVICYIVVAAVWLYTLTEVSGRAADVRQVFSMVGKGDIRIQALLISFAFCGLMEGLAGFGAPVAITCAMLFALGLPPIKAALLTMVGNALNVGFGAMAIPMTATAKIGGMESQAALLAQTASRITPIFLILVPFLLLHMTDGMRGVRQLWPVALLAGGGMGAGHFITAHFLSYELTAVVASLLSFAAVAGLLMVWTPTTPQDQRSEGAQEEEADSAPLTAGRITLALLPYWFVVLVFAVAKLWTVGVNIPAALKATDIKFGWPGLDGQLLTPSGVPSTDTIYTLSTVSSPGTMIIFAGIVVTLVYALTGKGGRFPFTIRQGVAAMGTTISSLKIAILTIVVVMALAYAMNFSGQTVAIGTGLAATGGAFAFFAPILGWVGTAVTGSATSSGALFGSLHATVAAQTGMSPQLLLGVNEVGGGMGKIISPQNLAIAATAVKAEGSEPELLRRALPYSLGLAVLLGIVTILAAFGVLGFLIAV